MVPGTNSELWQNAVDVSEKYVQTIRTNMVKSGYTPISFISNSFTNILKTS